MSFWIYRKKGPAYERAARLKLSGEDGALATFLQALDDEESPVAWEVSGAVILALAAPELDPAEHVVLLDLQGESLLEVCLQQVVGIKGVSHVDETDLVIATEVVFQGSAPVCPEDFKKAFVADVLPDQTQQIEALGLSGGTRQGKYRWTKPKMDIGAAVYPAKVTAAV